MKSMNVEKRFLGKFLLGYFFILSSIMPISNGDRYTYTIRYFSDERSERCSIQFETQEPVKGISTYSIMYKDNKECLTPYPEKGIIDPKENKIYFINASGEKSILVDYEAIRRKENFTVRQYKNRLDYNKVIYAYNGSSGSLPFVTYDRCIRKNNKETFLHEYHGFSMDGDYLFYLVFDDNHEYMFGSVMLNFKGKKINWNLPPIIDENLPIELYREMYK